MPRGWTKADRGAVRLSAQLAGVALTSLVGTAYLFAPVPKAATTTEGCGSLYSAAGLPAQWTYSNVYGETDTTLVANGDPVNIYVLDYQDAGTPVLDINRPGNVEDAQSFAYATADDLIGKNDEYKDAVRRISAYLSSHASTGVDRNSANPKALQLAIWEKLGQLTVPQGLSDEISDQEAWTGVIDDYFKALNQTAPESSSQFPTDIFAAFAPRQRAGSIELQISLRNREAAVPDAPVIASTAATSSAARTNALGEAILVLPDPAPGRVQKVRVSWEGTIPAGSVLKAQYKKEDPPNQKKDDPPGYRQGYVVTATPRAAQVSVLLAFDGSACR